MARTRRYQNAIEFRTWLMWWNDQINALLLPPVNTTSPDGPLAFYKRELRQARRDASRHKRFARYAQTHGHDLNTATQKIINKNLAGYPSELRTTDMQALKDAQASAKSANAAIISEFYNPATGAAFLGKKTGFGLGKLLSERISEELDKGKYSKVYKRLEKKRKGGFTRMLGGKAKARERDQAIDALNEKVRQHAHNTMLQTKAEKAHSEVENQTVRAIYKLMKKEHKGKCRLFSTPNQTAKDMAANRPGLQMLQELAGQSEKPDKKDIRAALKAHNVQSLETLQNDVDALWQDHQDRHRTALNNHKNYDMKRQKTEEFIHKLRLQRNALINLPFGSKRRHILHTLKNAVSSRDGDQLQKQLARNFNRDSLQQGLDHMQKKGPDTGLRNRITEYVRKLEDPDTPHDDLPDSPIGRKQHLKAWMATHGGQGLSSPPRSLSAGSKALSQTFTKKAMGIAHTMTQQQAVQPVANLAQSVRDRFRDVFKTRAQAHKTQQQTAHP